MYIIEDIVKHTVYGSLNAYFPSFGRFIKKPNKQAQKLQNVTSVFTYLQQTEGISLLGIGMIIIWHTMIGVGDVLITLILLHSTHVIGPCHCYALVTRSHFLIVKLFLA